VKHDKALPWAPRRATPLATLVCLALAATAAHGARLYRWKDADGNVHYADTMPQSASRERHSVLDSRGRVRAEVPSATEAEDAARRERAKRARQAERQARQREQHRRDRMLLETFTSGPTWRRPATGGSRRRKGASS